MRNEKGQFVKGIAPWNKGKVGIFKQTDEAKEKIRLFQIGKIISEDTRKKISLATMGDKNHNFGKHHPNETKRKIGIKQIGNTNTRGYHFSDVSKLKMSLAHQGEKCWNWKGGRVIASNGYVLIKNLNHPFRDKNGYVAEHRLVMEKFLGRYLTKKELIHHLNGIHDDNRIKNLELWTNSHPHGQRVEDKINWSIEFLSQYGYGLSENA